MIGDLILFAVFAIIWRRILKLKKENFREFVFEITIYLAVFLLTLIFYKFSYFLLSFVFDFGLFPSITGIFAFNFILIYLSVRFFVYYLAKKGHLSFDRKEKLIDKEAGFFDFFIHSIDDFQKVFTIFFAVNMIIIFTLLNSFIDVFTHQKILNYKNSAAINAMAEKLLSSAEGPSGAKENLAETIYFLRTVDPRAYEKIVKNTNSFVFSSRSTKPILAMAHMPSSYIEIDPIFSKSFNSIEDEIYFASLLIHESEHLKNFREDEGFIVNILNYALLSAKCNPLTNYQYFSDIRRSIFMYGDEWCAQISEVKFLRQFNVDYKEDFMKYFEDN